MIKIKENLEKLIKYLKIFRKYIIGENLPDWKLINKNKNKNKKINEKEERILIAVSAGGQETCLVFESMIGSVLQYEGYKVDYLLCDEILPACIMATVKNIDEDQFSKHGSKKICSYCFVRANNYLKSTGANVIKFSDFITNKDIKEINDIDFNQLSFDEIKKMKIDNVPIGEHANSGTIRYFANSDFYSLNNAKNIMIKYLRSAIITKKVSENLFKKNKYKEVLVNHGIYVPQGVILDCANESKLNTSTWMVGYRRNSVIISRNDTYHRVLIYDDNSKWENIEFTKKHEEKIDKYLKSRWSGSTDWQFWFKNPKFNIDEYFYKNGIDTSKPIVGLATNVLWDAQVSFPTNFFSDMLEWLFYTIDFFIKNKHLQLIIRIHPAEVNISKDSLQRVATEISKKYENLPKNILVIKPDDSISTYSVFEKCNCVIVYGSKIGSETAAANIPTIVCGESFIRNKNIAFDVNSIQEYKKILEKIPFPKNSVSKEKLMRAKKYAYHFWFRKTMEFKSIFEKNLYKGVNIGIKNDLFKIYDNNEDPALNQTINSIIKGEDYILEDEKQLNENYSESKF